MKCPNCQSPNIHIMFDNLLFCSDCEKLFKKIEQWVIVDKENEINKKGFSPIN